MTRGNAKRSNRAVRQRELGQDNLTQRRGTYRRKPGPARLLSARQERIAVGLRQRGASDKFVRLELSRIFGLDVSRETLKRTFRRFRVLGRRRSPVLTLLEESRGAPRLDLARLVLDLDELAQERALERTVERLDRIRGLATHRNQFARMREWCASVGVRLEKVDPREQEDALIEVDVKALRRVLTKRVVEAAVAVRLEFQERSEKT